MFLLITLVTIFFFVLYCYLNLSSFVRKEINLYFFSLFRQVVTEQLKHENKMKQGLQLELEKKSESLDVVNSRQKDLQRRVSEMTKSLMNFHDQSLQISVCFNV